jgi:hypothetical protein
VHARSNTHLYVVTLFECILEQAMVVSGRVLATKWDDATGSDVSTVAVKAFFCGCGPAQLKIFGHRGSSMCGAGVPEVGQEYTFFLCKDHESGQLSVNSFTLHTGLLGVSAVRNSKHGGGGHRGHVAT